MQNEMRDRLVELIHDASYNKGCVSWEELADYLLANGAIVPPCKVGDTVYEINTTFPDTPYINDFVVVALHITSGKNSLGHKKPSHAVVTPNKFMPPITKRIYLENFGKTVFLTKEEAEKALKERENNA